MTSFYSDEKLILKEKDFYTKSDSTGIREKIDFNKKYISYLNGEIAYYGEQKDGTNAFRFGFRTVDFIATVTLLNQIDFPKFKTMASFGNRLVDTNADNFTLMYETRLFMYPAVIELTKIRIKSYENLLKKTDSLENESQKIPRDEFLCESFSDYFSLAKIPKKIDGKCPASGKNAVVYQISQVPFFEGLEFVAGEGENSELIFIQIKDGAKKIYEAAKDGINEENPLKINVNFIVLPTEKFGVVGFPLLSKQNGKLTWDGKTLKITVKTGIFAKKILFMGENK